MNRESIVSIEGQDLAEMQREVERQLGDEWTITEVSAALILVDVSSGQSDWLPGPWRARFTARVLEGERKP